ncbi:RidA family protein [Bacillus piscicola]|uniref:RidA family protein n=1 Tax=Bacillus piscicola TaxID=1632684 RepID=UPI001F09B306|nr:RidA family protein [Bacillus piscicola]
MTRTETDKKELVLPSLPKQSGRYLSAKQVGNLLYVSGITCKWEGEVRYKGRVGEEITTDDGYEAARICALNLLAVIKAEIGDIHNIKQVVKVTGYVSCSPGFAEIPHVINGVSDLLTHVYGDSGEHVRCAVGVSSLPGNASVEADVIVELADR